MTQPSEVVSTFERYVDRLEAGRLATDHNRLVGISLRLAGNLTLGVVGFNCYKRSVVCLTCPY